MTATDDLVAALETAHATYLEAADAVDAVGEPELRQLADTHDEFRSFLARYREPASGTGRETFQVYVEFEAKLDEFADDLPDDLPARDAFEDAADHLDKRRLSPSDFDTALDKLEPVTTRLELLDRREAARDDYRHARHAVVQARRDLDDQIEDIERNLRFKDVDFSLPTDDLRSPITTYNTGVADTFDSFLTTTAARDVIAFLEKTEAYPLVRFEQPPTRLREFILNHEAGNEPIPTLIEYTGYTRSKLAHYVDDPGTFNAHIATNRSYLERLDSLPLQIEWPPPPAPTLRWRIRELLPVVGRFAPDHVTTSLRTVRDLTLHPTRYEDLRRTAQAHAALSEPDRERLQDSTMETEHDQLIRQRDRLTAILNDYPAP